ncbi:MAG: hypothetical protein K2X66_14270 [Cyanobacteria bacterium]|nr:hypothetical protein [Cyanobacteriota bacterium]
MKSLILDPSPLNTFPLLHRIEVLMGSDALLSGSGQGCGLFTKTMPQPTKPKKPMRPRPKP